MTEEDFRAAEVQDALGTADDLYNDMSRLKRQGIVTSDEDQQAKEHIAEIVETLTEKLPDDEPATG
jgi:hypothetical protein